MISKQNDAKGPVVRRETSSL